MMILRKWGRDRRGAAAIEFAAAASLLGLALLNTVDMGYYIYCRMEVENAAQSGAQAAWKLCSDDQTYKLPATQNCAGLNSAILSVVQSTTLGTAITLAEGYPTEGYYCVTSSNTLQSVGSLSSKPANCSDAGNSQISPGDYVQIQVTLNYTPIFSGITVMAASGITTITQTTWMRLS
jgi:Flp pilus assembly protein TadG